MLHLVFGIIAAATLGCGLMAVTSRRLVHSVLWLAMVLVATAALYVLLDATFIAAIQVILYAGGVITLMLFGVMLTEQGAEPGVPNPSHRGIAGGTFAVVVFGILATAIHRADPGQLTLGRGASTREIGRALLLDHLLAFEALSLLLLAAMIGAIVLARRRDP